MQIIRHMAYSSIENFMHLAPLSIFFFFTSICYCDFFKKELSRCALPFGHCRSPDERQLSEQPILAIRSIEHATETLMTNKTDVDNKTISKAHLEVEKL